MPEHMVTSDPCFLNGISGNCGPSCEDYGVYIECYDGEDWMDPSWWLTFTGWIDG